MVTIKRNLDPNDHYDGDNHIKYIVIHDTGNKTDTAEGNANYFVTGTRNASAHYFIDGDSIVQVVLDEDGAWHCGDGAGKYGITNRNSLSIEMTRVNNTVTEATMKNTLDLIKLKMAQYNIPLDRVVRHYDASRKNCPGSMSANNWAKWYAFKARINGTTVKPTAVVNNGYKGYGVVTGITTSLNVRSSASLNASIVGSIKNGEKYKIGTEKGNFYNIFFGDHGGWVSKDYMVLIGEVKTVAAKYGTVVNVSSYLNVRQSASTSSAIVGSAKNGEKFKIGRESNGFYNIFFGDHGGWVSKDFMRV